MTDAEIAALPPVLRAEHVAALFDVGVDTVYARVKDGTIPVLKLGRAFRFSRDRILALAGLKNSDGPEATGPHATTRLLAEGPLDAIAP